ncbi:hypothetical protein ACFL13_01065 [Patescibacteria group bacterium]
MLINKLLRKPYRQILKTLTKAVLNKHKPTIVAIMGDRQTSIGREVVYQVLKTKFPVRRNLETPEAEFSVPLTILGYPHYPKTNLEWIWVLIKTIGGLFTIKPYSHFLVLELNFVQKELMEYWLEITTPETAVIVGNSPIDQAQYNFKKLVKITSTHSQDILGPFKIAAQQVGKFYRIENQVIEQTLQTLNLPTSKIRLLPGKGGSLIVDATHYYKPTSLEAALEFVDEKEVGDKYLISNVPQDLQFAKSHLVQKGWQLNSQNLSPKNNDIIILRGNRVRVLQEQKLLINYS